MSAEEFPQALYVGASGVTPYDAEPMEEIMRDPRGLLLLWEPIRPNAKYVMGLDSSEGITGWNRGMRTEGDHKKDNGAIEVFRVDGAKELLWKEDNGRRIPDTDSSTKTQKFRMKDVQVAEWAGPCDAVEIARVAFVLGQIFRGVEEDQCELIWESWPGCGILATQELIRLGYANLWHWEYITDVAEETNRLGWRSSYESLKVLWYRARRHLMERRVVIRSRFLRKEYAGAVIDMAKMRAKAAYGNHDDRFMAANLALWAAHEWTTALESSHEEVRETPEVQDFQRYAPGIDEKASWKEWKSSRIAEFEE